ncbi:amino acid adenylation domain-containing protein [Janthinobacterium lividum]|nr:amino acid adenylation domain-containing protein [Janthinobacterium lividum]
MTCPLWIIFFALGGHSLLAAQLVADVNAKFATNLTLSSLFTAATIAALAQEVARRAGQTPVAGTHIARVQHGDVAVLSYAQRRFWFLDQYQSGNAFYTVPMAFSFHGTVNAVLLERALNAVIARHAALRTVFHVVDGHPYQAIRPALELSLQVVDLPASDQVRAEIAHEAAQPFDLVNGPLIRARLLRLPTGEQTLLVTIHHIVYDGSSTKVLLNELGVFYAALQGGYSAHLMPLPIQYLDYVMWERERFDQANVGEDVAFWKAHLAQSAPLLPLRTDRPRTLITHGAGAAFHRTLAAPLVARLNSLSSARHATLFMTLAAAMNVLLFRYTECEDFCIATLAANRPAQTDALIGNFINVVPLRATLRGSDSFYDVLESTKRNFLASYERQLPFELILNHVAPESVASYTPYAQVALNFHTEFNASMANQWCQDTMMTVSGREADSIHHAAFDLKLEITRTADSLALVYEYSTELYDTATITRWATQFEALLVQLTDQPARAVSLLDMLTGAERAAMEATWRADRADYPVPASLTALLNRQAARSPDATAVVCGAERLSYDQLHSQANRLAQALRAMGASQNVRIGLFVERSLPLVVGVLAVVKAGAAYVPLDPAYPSQRLAYMIDDAKPSILLTQRHLIKGLPRSDLPVLCIEDVAGEGDVDTTRAVNEFIDDMPGTLAYLIYTSGSTGEPKGAMVTKKGMLNLLSWFNRQFAISEADRVLLLSSFSFDLTQKNIFSVLMVGGQLHLAPEYYDPVQLGEYIDDARITFLNCAPSAYYPLLGHRAGNALRQVFLGGESINAALLHQAYRDVAHAPVIHNTYGPTEASDVVAFYSWDPRSPITTVPIGKAISNTRLYVLDAQLQPVMPGLTGELYVGGDGVGLGYLNRSELTAERFLPDPYAREVGERMYRTGDLVRQLASSDLEYIGRIDHQVKLRGFRVELGEVEAALMALPEIAHALVLMREDCPGDQRLVAYVIAPEGSVADAGGVRKALARILPAHLVPSHVEPLPAFPLTPNGKVDRHALPVPRDVTVVGEGAEPASDIERTLARIWSVTLKRDGIGLHDDFFALGGHSLLATQLVSQVRAELGVNLTLRTVFERRTLGALSSWIAANADDTHQFDSAEITLQCTVPDVDAPLSFAQQRLWLHAQRHPGRAVYNLPFALELSGVLDLRALRRSLVEIAQRHAVLRTSFDTIDGVPCARVHASASPPLYIRDLSDQQGAGQKARLDALMNEEIHTPFDLSLPALPRLNLFKLRAERHVLLITMHHIVADGWSVGLLLRELTAVYGAFQHEQSSPLSIPAYQYGDFARWQRQRFAAGAFADQLAYWRTKLDGAPGVLALPTDRARCATTSQRGGLIRFMIDASATGALTSMAEQAQGTLFMAFAALFATLLYRYTGQRDICVGTPIANRHHQELESMVGFFVNTVVLRMLLNDGSSFHSLLEQVRDTAQEAYAHQDLPFDELVGALGGRDATGSRRCSKSCWPCKTRLLTCWHCLASSRASCRCRPKQQSSI